MIVIECFDLGALADGLSCCAEQFESETCDESLKFVAILILSKAAVVACIHPIVHGNLSWCICVVIRDYLTGIDIYITLINDFSTTLPLVRLIRRRLIQEFELELADGIVSVFPSLLGLLEVIRTVRAANTLCSITVISGNLRDIKMLEVALGVWTKKALDCDLLALAVFAGIRLISADNLHANLPNFVFIYAFVLGGNDQSNMNQEKDR